MRFGKKLDFKDLFKIVKKECSQICYEYIMTGKFLYRASKHEYSDFEKITPRTDRQPLSTEVTLSKKFDEEFQKLFGWKARSEAMFCTGQLADLFPYGKFHYIVFPKNDYIFLWSKKVSDLYSSILLPSYNVKDDYLYSEVADRIEKDMKSGSMKFNSREEYAEQIRKEWREENDKRIRSLVLTYRNTNMKKAIQSGSEVMIKCDYYYVINRFKESDIADELGM